MLLYYFIHFLNKTNETVILTLTTKPNLKGQQSRILDMHSGIHYVSISGSSSVSYAWFLLITDGKYTECSTNVFSMSSFNLVSLWQMALLSISIKPTFKM